MMYLPAGFQNTDQLLTFHMVDIDGYLVDANSVRFRIFDPAGDRKFPRSGWQDVTNNSGRLGTGRYWAYNTAKDRPWIVPTDATEGTWKVEWRFQETSSSTEQIFFQKFDVVAAFDSTANTGFQGLGYRSYLSPRRVRTEGLLAADLSDVRLEELIVDAQDYIERETRQYFRPVFQTMQLDGAHNDKIHLDIPVIAISNVFLNDDFSSAIGREKIAVAFARTDLQHRFQTKPDPRRNPWIGFRAEVGFFEGQLITGTTRFTSGRRNQRIEGIFGFLESDGTVPRLLENAMLRLVYNTSIVLDPEPAGFVGGGALTRLAVDRHEERFTENKTLNLRSLLATSKEVEEILHRYKAPIKLSAPRQTLRMGGIRRG
jgi:hypothetical protein